MPIDSTKCEAYFQGEIRPVIFEVYTESGMPFSLIDDTTTGGSDQAYCKVTTAEGGEGVILPVTLVDNQPSRKKLLCSWNTGEFEVGYYNLQVWVVINVSGKVDAQGRPVVEAKLASELLTRYIKEK